MHTQPTGSSRCQTRPASRRGLSLPGTTGTPTPADQAQRGTTRADNWPFPSSASAERVPATVLVGEALL